MRFATAASLIALLTAAPALAVEGMWTPEQLPQIEDALSEAGLELDPSTLTDLTAFPMGAIISLGGCTASFVSERGLVVTNHHCAAGSIQYNSTEENNLLVEGFLAQTKADEVPAAPGTRVYVTIGFDDVTERMTGDLADSLTGRQRFDALDARSKEITAECEATPGRRCQVAAFHGGLEYKLITRLEIRDVRLVYAPPESIGTFGGDIDNWQWPRHTGDFSFYRAYVGPDGQPADFAAENVPFAPDHVLEVSAEGLGEGDFVMAAGYPGATNRYRTTAEVEHAFRWQYPRTVDSFRRWIATIEGASAEGSDARIKYESRLQGLNNTMKNLGGQLDGARKVDLVARRADTELRLRDWIREDRSRAPYARVMDNLDAAIAVSNTIAKRDADFGAALRSAPLGAARTLYRNAIERQKPDAERETGFQERDGRFLRQQMQQLERRYHPTVDKAEWMLFLEDYVNGPADGRVAAFDAALGLGATWDAAAVSATLDRLYAETTLGDTETRLALLDAAPEAFTASTDPFIQLAVAIHDTMMAREAEAKERSGRLQALRAPYMEALIAWKTEEGAAVYPDANGTLRVTYGHVQGTWPRDGMYYAPFTILEGIVEKDTGEFPFNSPEGLLSAVRNQDYGDYASEDLGSVPVNFLTDLDSTGGNSGSPTLNAKGQLVGLLFDGTLESVNSDWDFDQTSRGTIHVDSRYMLWVMEKIDGAQHLIDEMKVVRE